jgi:hypothetical protein
MFRRVNLLQEPSLILHSAFLDLRPFIRVGTYRRFGRICYHDFQSRKSRSLKMEAKCSCETPAFIAILPICRGKYWAKSIMLQPLLTNIFPFITHPTIQSHSPSADSSVKWGTDNRQHYSVTKSVVSRVLQTVCKYTVTALSGPRSVVCREQILCVGGNFRSQ